MYRNLNMDKIILAYWFFADFNKSVIERRTNFSCLVKNITRKGSQIRIPTPTCKIKHLKVFKTIKCLR